MSQQTYYRWRKKYAGLMSSEVLRLKLLEEENSKLKRHLADAMLDKEMLPHEPCLAAIDPRPMANIREKL